MLTRRNMIAGGFVAITVRETANASTLEDTIEIIAEKLRTKCQETRGGEWILNDDKNADFVIVRRVYTD